MGESSSSTESPSYVALKSLSETGQRGQSILKVNASPLFRSHSLFVPHLTSLYPQDIQSPAILEEVF